MLQGQSEGTVHETENKAGVLKAKSRMCFQDGRINCVKGYVGACQIKQIIAHGFSNVEIFKGISVE